MKRKRKTVIGRANQRVLNCFGHVERKEWREKKRVITRIYRPGAEDKWDREIVLRRH